MILFRVTNEIGIFNGTAEKFPQSIYAFCIQLQATMENHQQKTQRKDTCQYSARRYHPPHLHLPRVIPTRVNVKTATTAMQPEQPLL